MLLGRFRGMFWVIMVICICSSQVRFAEFEWIWAALYILLLPAAASSSVHGSEPAPVAARHDDALVSCSPSCPSFQDRSVYAGKVLCFQNRVPRPHSKNPLRFSQTGVVFIYRSGAGLILLLTPYRITCNWDTPLSSMNPAYSALNPPILHKLRPFRTTLIVL